MSEQLLTNYKKAKKDRENAESWNNLPNGQKYMSDKFKISIAHCQRPKLCRAGQQSQGGKNYWSTEEAFDSAILEHIVENWDKICPDVLARLAKKEKDALILCQSFIDKMQEEINLSK